MNRYLLISPCSKKIKKGEYEYRGFLVICFGYYEPKKRIVWEGINRITGNEIAKGFTKKEIMREIDYFIDGQ